MKETTLPLLIFIFAIIALFTFAYEEDWIIFPVIGGIVLILGIVFLLLRRKRNV